MRRIDNVPFDCRVFPITGTGYHHLRAAMVQCDALWKLCRNRTQSESGQRTADKEQRGEPLIKPRTEPNGNQQNEKCSGLFAGSHLTSKFERRLPDMFFEGEAELSGGAKTGRAGNLLDGFICGNQ